MVDLSPTAIVECHVDSALANQNNVRFLTEVSPDRNGHELYTELYIKLGCKLGYKSRATLLPTIAFNKRGETATRNMAAIDFALNRLGMDIDATFFREPISKSSEAVRIINLPAFLMSLDDEMLVKFFALIEYHSTVRVVELNKATTRDGEASLLSQYLLKPNFLSDEQKKLLLTRTEST